jgi:hypothetical protein
VPPGQRARQGEARKVGAPSHLDFHAVLSGVNALRCASTVRAARPAGVDPACVPLELAFVRWASKMR